MMSRRLGILGGTFDPIHVGHLDIAAAAQSALDLTEVVLIPASVPPHRPQPDASGYHRFAMVALSITGRPGWMASDVELRAAATSYTTTTLRRFHEQGYEAQELFFVIGADAFAEIETWKDYPAILDRAHFAVVSRPGWPVGELPARLSSLNARMVSAAAPSSQPVIFLIDAATANVSSTEIRRRRLTAAPIEGMVTPAVRQHIEQHELYAPAASVRREGGGPPMAGAGRLHGES